MDDKDNKDITSELLNEEEQLKAREDEIKKQEASIKAQKERIKTAPKKETPAQSVKSEEIAFESPQDRFRKIMKDMGFKMGVENITELFFRGDTNSPDWLEYTLNTGHIPPKNRELIISTYFGKPISELGITIETASPSKSTAERKLEELKGKSPIDSNLDDISKMADEELKDLIKSEKVKTTIAQLRSMREETERQNERKNNPQPAQTTTAMRQVQRPVILPTGELAKSKDGAVIYETLLEPIPQGGGGGGSDLLTALVLKMVTGDGIGASKPNADIAKLTESVTTMSQRIENIAKENELKSKDDEIKRLREAAERKEEEHKKDLKSIDEKYTDKLDRVLKENKEDLVSLKERFMENMAHKKELDDTIGAISSQHKKEMDELKKRVDTAQTNIEKTIVSKGTETADKVVGKVGDIAESVIKPMAEVMRDHYSTVIDKTRKDMGLPDLKSSIPKVEDSELEAFAKGGG